MTNEIAKPNQQISHLGQFADQVTSRQHIIGDFLRFSKLGKWQAGQDQDELPEGTRMLAHIPGIKHGWRKWEGNKLVEHRVGVVNDGFRVPERHELGDEDRSTWRELNGQVTDPWQETVYLTLLDEGGNLYTFIATSKTGMNTIGEITKAYVSREAMGQFDIPVIELRSRPWKHRDFGDMIAPVLKLTGKWVPIPENFKELSEAMEAEPEVDTEPFLISPPKAAVKPVAPKITAKTTAKAPVKASPAKGGKRPVKF